MFIHTLEFKVDTILNIIDIKILDKMFLLINDVWFDKLRKSYFSKKSLKIRSCDKSGKSNILYSLIYFEHSLLSLKLIFLRKSK